MNPFLHWLEEWQIDIPELDQDHKILVQLLNNLAALGNDQLLANSDSTMAKPTDDTLLEYYDAVVNHIRDHFDKEEAFMESIEYPNRHHHQRAHKVQMASFVAFRSQLAGIGLQRFSASDINWIKMWFLDHVFGEDKEYASYYRQSAR